MTAMDQTTKGDRLDWFDCSAFSRDDALNLILQRSRIIEDSAVRNTCIAAWSSGDPEPLMDYVDLVGIETIAQRGAAIIYTEYDAMRSVFEERPPTKVTDIGCGYALFDLFLARDFGCEITLVDLETSQNRNFGFEKKGSAYSDLDVAAQMLAANGVARERVTTINPEKDSLAGTANSDFVFSFLSCGFHYPWTTYADLFGTTVRNGGRACLDLRKRTSKETMLEMSEFGDVRELPFSPENKAVRVLIETAK